MSGHNYDGADLGNDDRNSKFMRLMGGGAKKKTAVGFLKAKDCGLPQSTDEAKSPCQDEKKSSQNPFRNDWDVVDLGDENRKNKFLKLMGAKKTAATAVPDAKKPHGIRTGTEEQELQKKLEDQYQQSLMFKLSGGARARKGFGFAEPPPPQPSETNPENPEQSKETDGQPKDWYGHDNRGDKDYSRDYERREQRDYERKDHKDYDRRDYNRDDRRQHYDTGDDKHRERRDDSGFNRHRDHSGYDRYPRNSGYDRHSDSGRQRDNRNPYHQDSGDRDTHARDTQRSQSHSDSGEYGPLDRAEQQQLQIERTFQQPPQQQQAPASHQPPNHFPDLSKPPPGMGGPPAPPNVYGSVQYNSPPPPIRPPPSFGAPPPPPPPASNYPSMMYPPPPPAYPPQSQPHVPSTATSQYPPPPPPGFVKSQTWQ